MSHSSLLVGGTQVLERALQHALGEPPRTFGTVDELTAQLAKSPGAIVVLGPTLKRALASVAQVRPEGQKQPTVIVVYRDEQKDEAKRHQGGKTPADHYIAQSRVQKELDAVLRGLAGGAAESELEELDGDVVLELAEDDDAVTELSGADLDEVELQPADAGTPLVHLSSEVLGELDVAELEEDEVVESLAPDAMEALDEDADLEEIAPLEEEVTLDADAALDLADDADDAGQSLEEVLDGDVLEDEAPTEPLTTQPVASTELAALQTELVSVRAQLASASAHGAELAAEVASLREAARTHAAETAALTEQLKAARAQLGALQTKVVDARIQAEEAAGIVQAIAAKLG